MKSLIIENIHETLNFKLFKQVYFEILVPCFPDPEDHISWKYMKRMAKKSFDDPTMNKQIMISVSKQILPDGTERPVSFFMGAYYQKSQTGLISYMGMRDNCEGLSASNIQKQVLIEMKAEAARFKKELKAVLSLVDLPEYANPKYITLPPIQRIMIMERNGASHIPINFRYPMFKTKIPFMKRKIIYHHDVALLGYKLHGVLTTESPEVIKNFLDDFYASYNLDIQKDPILKEMKTELDTMPKGRHIKLSKHYRELEKKKKIIKEVSIQNIVSSDYCEKIILTT